MDKLKVLFHVNEPGKWPGTVLNINNFINDQGRDNVYVEVVANGAGVVVYTGEKADPKLLEDMSRLAGLGVIFAACRNALKMHSLDENALPPFVTAVPAGITEIARKQAAGYAYIKP